MTADGDETRGIALAGVSLAIGLVTALHAKGLPSADEQDKLLDGVLAGLEEFQPATDPGVQKARRVSSSSPSSSCCSRSSLVGFCPEDQARSWLKLSAAPSDGSSSALPSPDGSSSSRSGSVVVAECIEKVTGRLRPPFLSAP